MRWVTGRKMAVLTAAGTELPYLTASWDNNYQQSHAGVVSPSLLQPAAIIASFWGPVLSAWSSYSRIPEIMTTDRTMTALLSGRQQQSVRLNRLKTHTHEVGVDPQICLAFLKTAPGSKFTTVFHLCCILIILSPSTDQRRLEPGPLPTDAHTLVRHFNPLIWEEARAAADSQQNQWEESCKSLQTDPGQGLLVRFCSPILSWSPKLRNDSLFTVNVVTWWLRSGATVVHRDHKKLLKIDVFSCSMTIFTPADCPPPTLRPLIPPQMNPAEMLRCQDKLHIFNFLLHKQQRRTRNVLWEDKSINSIS